MKLLKTIPLALFIAANLLLIVAMIFCAYTSTLPPQQYPQFSYMGLMFPAFVLLNAIFIPFWLIFKWKLTAIPVAGMLLCSVSIRTYIPINFPSTPPDGSLKILSYNVLSWGSHKGNPWDENPILRYIQESQADIVCLQEVTLSEAEQALDFLTPIYPYRSVEKNPNNYIAILSKFPIEDVAKIDYAATNNFSYAYHVMVGNDTLLVINNHLESYKLSKEDKEDYKSIIKNYKHPDSNNSETKYLSLTEKLSMHDSIRGIQADSVAAFIQKHQGESIIVCGDFNSSPISYVHHRMTEQLNDAYTRSGNGPGTSYNRSGMYFRLDHIFVSPNIKAYGARVDKSIKESDHYPISCFVKIGEN